MSDALDLFTDATEVGTLGADALRWLLDQGVTVAALATPWAIHAGHVSFEPSGLYRPNICGEFAYIFGCIDGDGLADLVAWSPRVGGIASRLGVAAVLGQRQAEEARDDVTARPLRIWRNPLGWLKAGRNGVVIVDHLGAAHLLADLPIAPEEDGGRHARELRAGLRVPPPRIIAAWKPASKQRAAA
jgi:hypothetical protein